MSDLAPPRGRAPEPQARRSSQGSSAAVDLQAALADQLQERRGSAGSLDDPLLNRRASEGSNHAGGPSLQDWGGAPTWQDRQEVQPGIVVRNTFIDVCPLEEESDGSVSPAGSPTRRNLSAPPSPTRNRNPLANKDDGEGSEDELADEADNIPHYRADGSMVGALGGADGPWAGLRRDEEHVWGAKPPGAPDWKGERSLQAPPGSPQKVRTKSSTQGPRPALGDFLIGGADDAKGADPFLGGTGVGVGLGSLPGQASQGLLAGSRAPAGASGYPGAGLGPELGRLGLDPLGLPGSTLPGAGGAAGLRPGLGYGQDSLSGLGQAPDPLGGSFGNHLAAQALQQQQQALSLREHQIQERLASVAAAQQAQHQAHIHALQQEAQLQAIQQEAQLQALHQAQHQHLHLSHLAQQERLAGAPPPPMHDALRGEGLDAYGRDAAGRDRYEAPAYILGTDGHEGDRAAAAAAAQLAHAADASRRQPGYLYGVPPGADVGLRDPRLDALGGIYGGDALAQLEGAHAMAAAQAAHAQQAAAQAAQLAQAAQAAQAAQLQAAQAAQVAQAAQAAAAQAYANQRLSPESMLALQLAGAPGGYPGAPPPAGAPLGPLGRQHDPYAALADRRHLPPASSGYHDPRHSAAADPYLHGAGGPHGGRGAPPGAPGAPPPPMGMPGELGRRGSAGGPPGHNYPDHASSQGLAGVGGQPGNSPWVMPGAMPSAQALQGAMGGAGGGRNKGKDGGAKKSEAQGATEQKGRVPLSGGGPKRTDYIKKYGGPEGAEGSEQQQPKEKVPITTMMLKNIPCRKSQEEVAMHIDQKGFSGRYDFFYLPRDVKFRANLGYAFINFLTPEDASSFEQEMNGYRFNGSGSTKACAIVPAHVQGLVNNLAAFKRTEVMRSSRKPYFAGEGKE